MQKYLVEFIGTFFLVFTIGMVSIDAPEGFQLAPLAIGSALMVMVYAGGHISGAHYNPAVTLGVWIRGKCDTVDVVPYLISQLIGASAAAFMVMFLKGTEAMGEVVTADRSGNMVAVLLAELLFTFALVWVVLNVATAKGTENNSFYGLAIGFTVLTGAFSVGGVSGGAFNPAVAVGISLMKLSAWPNIWMFLVANFGAAAIAAIVFRAVNPKEA